MRMVILNITPNMAKNMLKRNTANNRPIRRETVKRYAEDMKNGDWQLTPDGISFNSANELVNGQHRLSAIVESGCTVKMCVYYGVDCDVFDIGRARTFGNAYYMQTGGKIPDRVSGCATLYYKIVHGNDEPSYTQKARFCEEYADVLEVADRVCNHKSNGKRILANAPSIFAVFCALLSGVSEEDIKNFCYTCNSGFAQGSKDTSAAIAFRNYVLIYQNGKAGRQAAFEKTATCQSAIMKYVAGKKCKYIRPAKTCFYTEIAFKKD